MRLSINLGCDYTNTLFMMWRICNVGLRLGLRCQLRAMLGEWAVVARATIRTIAVSNPGGMRLGWRSIELYRNARPPRSVLA